MSCFCLAATVMDIAARDSIEIGLEHLRPAAPAENAAFTGLLLNYYPAENIYIGTSQMSLSFRGNSEYRPDFHIGLLLPLFAGFSLEANIGMDFFTALIVALAIANEDDALNHKFSANFYAPYFTATTALRLHWNGFALKLIGQTQFGGYLESEHSAFNASFWLGLGATYRFAL